MQVQVLQQAATARTTRRIGILFLLFIFLLVKDADHTTSSILLLKRR
jgi:hypothetical protein